jgi:hypothetical protein
MAAAMKTYAFGDMPINIVSHILYIVGLDSINADFHFIFPF